MRISDWSSDVCSSDLLRRGLRVERREGEGQPGEQHPGKQHRPDRLHHTHRPSPVGKPGKGVRDIPPAPQMGARNAVTKASASMKSEKRSGGKEDVRTIE